MCITEELNNVQNVIGPLSINNLFSSLTSMFTNPANIPKNDTCTACTQAAFTIAKQDFPSLFNGNTQQTIASECGPDFIGEYHCFQPTASYRRGGPFHSPLPMLEI
jgi:hypothetical protein